MFHSASTATGSTFALEDPDAATFPSRFYRAPLRSPNSLFKNDLITA